MPQIFPLSSLDLASRAYITNTAFIVDGIFDVEKTRAAVKELSLKWPSLGGRLRKSDSETGVELVIPDPADAVMDFTVKSIPQKFASLQRLAVRTAGISIQVPCYNTSIFLPEVLYSGDDYITKDVPIFRITAFILEDTTVLAFNRPHIYQDGGALDMVVKALVAIIRGKNIMPEMAPNPLDKYRIASQQYMRTDTKYPGWNVYTKHDYELLQHFTTKSAELDGPLQRRIIYFPRAVVDQLKEECMKELNEAGHSIRHLSSGEIILAWLYKHAFGAPDLEDDQPTRIMTMANLRFRLLDSYPPSQPFLRNASVPIVNESMTCKEIRDSSLAQLVLSVRQMLENQATPDNLENHLRWRLQQDSHNLIPFQPTDKLLAMSNRLTFRWGDLDFSPALIPNTGTGRVRGVLFCDSAKTEVVDGDGFIDLPFRDADGGIVATVTLREDVWASDSFSKYVYPAKPNVETNGHFYTASGGKLKANVGIQSVHSPG